MNLTFAEFKSHVQSGEFNNKTHIYKKLIRVTQPYVNGGNVKYFYPRNIFNENEEEEFIFFLEKYIVFVALQKDGKYLVENIPLKPEKISIVIPEHYSLGLTLRIKNEIGEEIILKSLKDSNESWKDEYQKLIEEIYKFLIER